MTILYLIENEQFIRRLSHQNDRYQSTGRPVKNDAVLNGFWGLNLLPKTLYNQYDLIHLYQLPSLKISLFIR